MPAVCFYGALTGDVHATGSHLAALSKSYKVIFVPFSGGAPSGEPIDVLTGFVNEKGEAMGRPVGVAIDKRGALLLADDVGNVIWRVARSDS